MSRHQQFDRIVDGGLVAILRSPSGELLADVADTLFQAGIDVIEVTLTVPGALNVIAKVKERLGDKILLGAGTILDAETGRAAMLAGAEFLVTPALRTDVIELGHRYDKLVLPGVFTPTEALTAWEAGAPLLKLFPAEIGGPGHLKALKGPFPQMNFVPTGGVNLETLPEFLKAGAVAVGLGSSLVTKQALADRDLQSVYETAEKYVTLLKSCRAAKNGSL